MRSFIIGGVISQSLRLQALVRLKSQHGRVHTYITVFLVLRAVDVVLVCLRTSCSHVTEVGGP